jgi:hypothetical protein
MGEFNKGLMCLSPQVIELIFDDGAEILVMSLWKP